MEPERKLPIMRVENLDIGYGTHVLLRDLELAVCPGEVVTLIGPNGVGKSTFLKTITRQIRPLGGTIWLSGIPLDQVKPEKLARTMAILTTQKIRPELMTCRDVVSTGRYPYTGRFGILSGSDHECIQRAMELVGVQRLGEAYFSDVSDGQRQRVMLARAVCQEPRILVMDEPASYLDIRYKLELVDLIRKLSSEQKVAVIMTLHELELVRRVSDRIVCMKEGRIDRIGPPEEIFAGDCIRSLFDADPERFREVYPGLSMPSEKEVPLNYYIRSGQKLLRCGITTGTCAAAASEGAALLLLGGAAPEFLTCVTPKGLPARVRLEEARILSSGKAQCAVRKDAGDDPDVTDGLLIRAEVERTECGIEVDGGEGVGRVTKPGLDQPVGASAINSVPRQMIRESVRRVCEEYDYHGGLRIVISIPGGEEIAKHTFNATLGVEGGLSILGTSGIVEPMSEQALVETIRLALSSAAREGDGRAILTFGNYGEKFLEQEKWEHLEIPVVKCSNYIGEALDIAAGLSFRELLLVGHAGKLVKLAAGVMNTHSRQADCRREIFCAHAAVHGASGPLCRSLMEAVSSDACLELLETEGILEPVCGSILSAIQEHLSKRAGDAYRIGAVMFSNRFGVLGMTEQGRRILEDFQGKMQ